MIDVVFLLIIFFMTTAQIARETRADLDLPKEVGEQNETAEEAGLVINVLADGKVVINDETVDRDTMEVIIKRESVLKSREHQGGLKVTLRVDRNASAEHLNDVITRMRALNVAGASLATEVPN